MSLPTPWIALSIALVALHFISRYALLAVGRKAVSRQPDQIHLVPETPEAGDEDGMCVHFANPLEREGFADVGTYSVVELRGVKVRFLVNEAQCVYAALYQHPRAGEWYEIISRYQDGTGITYTIMRDHGLSPEPGNEVVRQPGAGPVDLCRRALAERPQRPLIQVNAGNVTGLFSEIWARSIAWRKSRGITPEEVARAARVRKAA